MSATDTPIRIPAPVGRLLSSLPQWPPSAALATVLNLGLVPRLDPDALELLREKTIRILVCDAGVGFTLHFDGRAFRPRSAGAPADVTISATAWDFGLLAARKEDPDTLFFARRLTMEGDTEAGLVVKNMLDAVDLTRILADAPLGALERLRALSPFRRSSSD
jgi:predicted lipid carrier protein YhbT